MGLKIYGQNANLISIGDNVNFGFDTMLVVDAPISIGDNVMIGHRVTLITAYHDYDEDMVMRSKPISIGDYAWVTTNVIVLPGVKIGKGAVVGAGSIVTKDVPEMEVHAGSPAKKINQRKRIGNYTPGMQSLFV